MCISVPKRIAQKRFRSMRRNHRECKMDDCQDPKTFSIACDLPDSRALIDANEAIKRLWVRFTFFCFLLLRCPLLAQSGHC